MLLVGRHAARELKHLAGSLPRFVSPARRCPSAARFRSTPLLQFSSRRLPWLRPVAGSRCRVRGQRSVVVRAWSQQGHPAFSTITPAPCRVGVSRGAQSQYSFGMRSLGFHHSGFNSVRANPALVWTRGAAFSLRWASRRAPRSSIVRPPNEICRTPLQRMARFRPPWP